ncbi:hypothetical protein ABBQ32_008841 [Trebouxia sp. C0010 RCD-2024]
MTIGVTLAMVGFFLYSHTKLKSRPQPAKAQAAAKPDAIKHNIEEGQILLPDQEPLTPIYSITDANPEHALQTLGGYQVYKKFDLQFQKLLWGAQVSCPPYIMLVTLLTTLASAMGSTMLTVLTLWEADKTVKAVRVTDAVRRHCKFERQPHVVTQKPDKAQRTEGRRL